MIQGGPASGSTGCVATAASAVSGGSNTADGAGVARNQTGDAARPPRRRTELMVQLLAFDEQPFDYGVAADAVDIGNDELSTVGVDGERQGRVVAHVGENQT